MTMDITRRRQLIHDQAIYADAIGIELARLLERPLTPEESNLVADTTVSQGFMSSEADARSLHFSVAQEDAVGYLERVGSLVKELRAQTIAVISKGCPQDLLASVQPEDHPNLIAWQCALLDTHDRGDRSS